MINKNSGNFSFISQFAIFLGLTGGGVIIGSLLSGGVWMMMTGKSIMAMATDMFNPAYYNAMMVMQAVSTFFMFFLPVYFFAMICYRKPSRFIGFSTRVNFQQILLIIGILILTFPLSGALAEINKMIPIPKSWEIQFKAMEASRAAQEAILININSFARYIISMILIGLLPGIFEEVYFRGGLQNIFTRWFRNPWVAIIVTSLLFSAIHISYYGFLVRFALGVILGLLYYYSGSIWLSILFHFLYNGVQVTALYLITANGSKSTKDIEENFPLWAGVVALVLIVYAFIRFRQISLLQQQKYVEEDINGPDDFRNWVTNNPKID